MWKRSLILAVLAILVLVAVAPISGNGPAASAALLGAAAPGAPGPAPQNPYTPAWLAAHHGQYDNIWTAEYETRLQQTAGAARPGLFGGLLPNYGPDVRMSNGNVLGSG